MTEQIIRWFDRYETELAETARYIFAHPEVAWEETLSSECLAGFLERQGFSVTWNAAGLKTAFTAEWGEGRPILGFLAEYDALPGLFQKPESHKTAENGGRPGHGCGHNLLGTACAGAAAAVKAFLQDEQLPGTIRVYGCPAEEVVAGKIRMDRAGLFDDLSAAVTWHPFDRNRISYDIWMAQDVKNYTFRGVSAHAAKHPELGRSALDAAELMNIGVNYLREHVTDDVRMHYTYTDTGGAANIVPDRASTNYFIRALKRSRLDEVSARVDDCARGAALMTGTSVEIELVTGNKEMKTNRPLAEAFYQAMEQVPLPQYSEEELAFAAEISRNAGLPGAGKDAGGSGRNPADASAFFPGLEPLEDEPVPLLIGTDVTEVSHTVPTVMLSAAAMCKGTPLHHWAAAAQAGMSIGEKGMLYAAQCMAEGSVLLLTQPKILADAWKAFSAGQIRTESPDRQTI